MEKVTYTRKEMPAIAMSWDPQSISNIMQKPLDCCIPLGMDGIRGVRWSNNQDISENVLVDIVPLTSGLVLVAFSKEGKEMPELEQEVRNTLISMGITITHDY